MKVIYTLKPVDGRRIRLTTDTEADPRWRLPIEGTKFKLAIPYSVCISPFLKPARLGFTIGHIEFTGVVDPRDTHKPWWSKRIIAVRPSRPIPASWFVDLSTNVLEESKAA